MDIFVSYSHTDSHWLERLKVHLRPVERNGHIDVWSDTRIGTGTQWRKEIKSAIAAAQVAILLVSADFLASDFIATNELPPLLMAAKKNSCAILPIIVGPCLYPEIQNLKDFQAANSPRSPLGGMKKASAERVLSRVALTVLELAKRGPARGRSGRSKALRRREKGRFLASGEIDELIKGIRVGEWASAERLAPFVVARTDAKGKNRLFDALLAYADCPVEDDRFWGATMTAECCLRLAPWLITRAQILKLARHPNFSVRSVAASICMDMAQSAADRVPVDILMPLSRYDEDWYVEAPANAALKAMAGAFPATLGIFYSRLRSTIPEERLHAAEAIKDVAEREAELLDRGLLSEEIVRIQELGDDDVVKKLQQTMKMLKGVQPKHHWRYGL